MLETQALTKRFNALTVCNQISLRLEPGERRVVLGPNGAGKTTLFNLLTGEIKPDSGSITLAGQTITQMSVDGRARLGMARSFQKNNVFAELSVRENLSLAASIAQRQSGVFWRDVQHDASIRETVADVAHQMGLTEYLDETVQSLSYGVRRQLEVGLALATRPTLLLMDEPTSGVSPSATDAFHRLVKALPRDLTVLIIEHDMDLAFDVADSVSVLNHGEVVFEGTPEAAKASPLLQEIYMGTWAQPSQQEAGHAQA